MQEQKAAHPISVIVLTKNSGKTLRRCLKSLQCFNEIIALDNGSEDDTLEILQEFTNVSILQHQFIGFGPLRNLAIKQANNDWIFCVDSDEEVPKGLADEITSLQLDEQTIYSIPRINHYRNRPMRCCGWHPDRVLRIFNRKSTEYHDQAVHESVNIRSGMHVKKLGAPLLHYPFHNVAGLIDKMQHYSTLYAAQHQGKVNSSTTKAFFRALWAFGVNYILQKGFLYGHEGLLISVTNAGGVFFKYCKLREQNRE